MEILHHFANQGFKLYILSTGNIEDRDFLNQQGFECTDVGSVVANPVKAFQFFQRLILRIREIKPEIIFSFTIRPNIFGSLVARLLKIPIVSNVTGTGPLLTDKSILYIIIRWMYKFAFKTNQRVFFQNEDDYQYFITNNFVTNQQAKLLPGSGVDSEYFTPRPKTNNRFSFLMISRLIKDKGVIEYVEASELVRREFPNIQFKLLGPFWTQSISKNTITKKDVENWQEKGRIEYLGHTIDVRPFIADSDCIVLPSYREGCANVLMQAASMAKPLIASDVTGCRNLINNRETGYLCEPRNIEDLAAKMMTMYELSIEKRDEMGRKGRLKMQSEYQKAIVLRAYQDMVFKK